MEYSVGQRLMWVRSNNHDKPEVVEVVSLRKRGAAVLSNGWTVDEDGIAEGSARVAGGSVRELAAPEACIPQGLR